MLPTGEQTMCDRYCRCRDRHSTRFQNAIDLQDGGNLRAIARELVRAADEATDAGGTLASYSDPAVVLIVNKLESLVYSNERFSDALAECETRSKASTAGMTS
jgi:hypothetical protein